MKVRDLRTLARLLKDVDGDWNKLRRNYEARPQPKRGRPLGAAKKIDDWLLVALKTYCENSKSKDGLAPHAAIKSLVSEMERELGKKVFCDKCGANIDSVTRRLYQKMTNGKRRRQLEQAAAELFGVD
jgi:hypothetical protein